jgi:negative regulator of sigma E activity
MQTPSNPRLSRRRWFAGAGAVGAVAAVAAVAPQVTQSPTASTVQQIPKPERGGGYRVSEHIRRYYQTTQV